MSETTSKDTSKDSDIDDIPECFYETGRTYEITINPKKQYEKNTKRFIRIYHDLYNMLGLMKNCEIVLQPELSEPTYGNIERGGFSRLHFHGYLVIPECPLKTGKFILNELMILKLFCDFQINPLRLEYWKRYMNKQKHIMKSLCEEYNVPYLIENKVKPYLPPINKNKCSPNYFTKWECDESE